MGDQGVFGFNIVYILEVVLMNKDNSKDVVQCTVISPNLDITKLELKINPFFNMKKYKICSCIELGRTNNLII
jgi:hypothetical protein